MRYQALLASCLGAALTLGCGAQLAAAPPSPADPSPADPAPAAAPQPLDLTHDGVFTADRWEYRFTLIAPGSKSEGYQGELFFDGTPVEEPSPGDFYHTPWGPLVWHGNPVMMWGKHGWMPRPTDTTGGHAIVEPWRASGRPVIMAMLLAAGTSGPGAAATTPPEPWVRAEMAKLGVSAFVVTRPWFPLTDQALTLEDTKLTGTLTARQAQARQDEVLTVLLDGTHGARIDLPRQDGATRLVKHTLDANLERLDLYLALRVDRASRQWLAPRDLGPGVRGQTVKIEDVDEVVLALPGDKNSGNVWEVSKLACDNPFEPALRTMGQPQFVRAAFASASPAPASQAPLTPPGTPGTFENLFRVRAVGTCELDLVYHRPWQTDAAPTDTFHVTLQVTDLPMRLPMRGPGDAK